MTDTVTTQVLVVGAGPVGLLAAGELLLGGAQVTVIERLHQPTGESRASVLHARTMEIFDARGLLRRFGELPGDVNGHFGGIPLNLTLPGPYPGQWKVPQVRTEAVLQDWALSLGADLRRGHELAGLTVHPAHVEADVTGSAGHTRIRADYLVGCDGENSTARRLAGLDFAGEAPSRELLRADIAGIDIPSRRFERLPAGLVNAARRADGVTRVMLHEFGRGPVPRTAPPTFDEVRDAWLRVTGEDIGDGTALWVSVFDDSCRQATSYRAGRVLVAGDAAHMQMPVGGQALNLGLQDAMNLGWKLAAVACGRAPESLLDSYHAERHPVGRRVLANIRAQAAVLLGGPEVGPLRAVLAELIGHERGRRHLAAMISGLDISYDGGPGSMPVSPGGALTGARVPPRRYRGGPGATSTTSTAELLRAGRGLLLDLSGDPGLYRELREAALPWADRVDVVAARPDDDGPDSPGGVLLVRPDGHVAWDGSGGGAPTAGLRMVLERWFGPQKTVGQEPRPFTTSDGRSDGMSRFEGKTALVTGASRGIGREIAERLAEDGALVAVHYSTGETAAMDVVAAIEKGGGLRLHRAGGIR